MRVLEELLATIDQDVPVQDVAVGCFFAAVSSRRMGLSSVLRPPRALHREDPLPAAGDLLPSRVGALARMALSESLLEASVGVAALNSVLDVPGDYRVVNAAELLAEHAVGRHVVVVGGFPFAAKLRSVAGSLEVFEMDPVPGSHERDAAELFDELPRAQVLVISATTLINHTFDRIRRETPTDAFVVMVGPSTPLSPILFDWGVDVLAGTVVVDQVPCMRTVLQGATFRQVRGVKKIAISKGR